MTAVVDYAFGNFKFLVRDVPPIKRGKLTPERASRADKDDLSIASYNVENLDAVNDAAALKQADIGVAMGSGSEVSKQAARMVLTDDNFGTLVHAVELGRSIYGKVVSYIRYQMTQLLSLVLLFVTATVFNINSGVAMTPLMVLFLNFFVSIFPVVVIMLDRPRHEEAMAEIREAGARIRLIPHGDVSAALAAVTTDSPVDLLWGIGGTPEGVLAAAAIQCVEVTGALGPNVSVEHRGDGALELAETRGHPGGE